MQYFSRRSFIQSAMASMLVQSGMNISPLLFVSANSKRSKKLVVSEEELMGITTPHLTGNNYRLRSETAKSFVKMVQAARKDGLVIAVISSYRGFESQKTIWNAKYLKYQSEGLEPEAIIEKIIEYSSLPGTSRHHWGTEIDIVEGSKEIPEDPLIADYFQKNGPYHTLYQWLKENASTFQFLEPYTNDPNRTGFAYEPWHWSFAELSIPFLEKYQKIDLPIKFSKLSLEGRSHLTASFLSRYFSKWIRGINPRLIP